MYILCTYIYTSYYFLKLRDDSHSVYSLSKFSLKERGWTSSMFLITYVLKDEAE